MSTPDVAQLTAVVGVWFDGQNFLFTRIQLTLCTV